MLRLMIVSSGVLDSLSLKFATIQNSAAIVGYVYAGRDQFDLQHEQQRLSRYLHESDPSLVLWGQHEKYATLPTNLQDVLCNIFALPYNYPLVMYLQNISTKVLRNSKVFLEFFDEEVYILSLEESGNMCPLIAKYHEIVPPSFS